MDIPTSFDYEEFKKAPKGKSSGVQPEKESSFFAL
jgi:hypothetical protein